MISFSRPLRAVFVLAIFAISLVPAVYTFYPVPEEYKVVLPELQEMRPLAQLPTSWEGRWFDFDKNYHKFERGFSDQLGLRNLMVRTKNEIDYRLFESSRRVYFGKQDELYGRNISDNELPAMENLLADPQRADQIYRGVVDFSARMKAQGVTVLLITPMSKQYFTQERIPRFLPKVSQPSHFMALYQRLKQTPDLHFVDVYDILESSRTKFPIFYRQDFHWTDLSAMAVAADVTNRIARMEQAPVGWRHRLESHNEVFLGSEARFAALLLERAPVQEPMLTKTWQDVHQLTQMDAKQTGIEFITDKITDRGLLPPTCMYGNSFSDGMLRAGLVEHFEQFIKFDRTLSPPDAAALMQGRCKYLIVQMLDSAPYVWTPLAK